MISKKRIEEAALMLVAEKGYKSVRMDDLAGYLSISKKTLYNHFDSKENLLREALEKRVTDNLILLEKISEDRERPFIPRLKDVLKTAGRALTFSGEYKKDLGIPRDLVESIFPRLHDHILKLVRNLVQEGLEEGYVRTDIPTEILPYIHLGIIETFLSMETRYGVKATIKDMLVFIESIVFSGLLTEKGRRVLVERNLNED